MSRDFPDPDAPLTDASTLRVGDVIQIAVQLPDKTTGQPFWWKRFACVVGEAPPRRTIRRITFYALTLKMQVDMERDLREIDLQDEKTVVTYLPEERHPQGVIAMKMKLVALGHIKLEGE